LHGASLAQLAALADRHPVGDAPQLTHLFSAPLYAALPGAARDLARSRPVTLGQLSTEMFLGSLPALRAELQTLAGVLGADPLPPRDELDVYLLSTNLAGDPQDNFVLRELWTLLAAQVREAETLNLPLVAIRSR
jgi:hypothetical protein